MQVLKPIFTSSFVLLQRLRTSRGWVQRPQGPWVWLFLTEMLSEDQIPLGLQPDKPATQEIARAGTDGPPRGTARKDPREVARVVGERA